MWVDLLLGTMGVATVALVVVGRWMAPVAAAPDPVAAVAPTTTVAAAAPPATTVTTAPPAPQDPARCHPSYRGTCIPPTVPDADCFGVGGDGPWLVRDYDVQVVGPDVFKLDVDYNGVACESQPGMLSTGGSR